MPIDRQQPQPFGQRPTCRVLAHRIAAGMHPLLTSTQLRPTGRDQRHAMTRRKPRPVTQWLHLKFDLKCMALAFKKHARLHDRWEFTRLARRSHAEARGDRTHRPRRQQGRGNRHRMAMQSRQGQRLARCSRQHQQLRRGSIATWARGHHDIVAIKTGPIIPILELRAVHPEALRIFLQG